MMEPAIVQSKFRGSILGSLMGDCLGAPFEGQDVTSGDKIIIQRYFDKMEDESFKSPFKKYTDDTAMMKSMARFLIDKPEPDYKYLAKLFVTEYFKEPRRGYGQNVVDVFEKLKNSKYEDPFCPAKQQFNGSGSYGNGGAMRMAPIPLFFYDNYQNMIKIATNSTKITHSNVLGVNGAILQCLAIHQAFLTDPQTLIDTDKFCKDLQEKIKAFEDQDPDEDPKLATAYQNKMKTVQSLLSKKYSDDLDDEVLFLLGNGIGAYDSIPTAIYCFLRAQTDIPEVQTNNCFRRTLQYAITLGGDTDTIACMAGAIVGAYLGEEAINRNVLKHCEKYEQFINLADDLYNAGTG